MSRSPDKSGNPHLDWKVVILSAMRGDGNEKNPMSEIQLLGWGGRMKRDAPTRRATILIERLKKLTLLRAELKAWKKSKKGLPERKRGDHETN